MSLSRRNFIKLLSSAMAASVLPKVQTEPPIQSDVDELRESIQDVSASTQDADWYVPVSPDRLPDVLGRQQIAGWNPWAEIDEPVAWHIDVEMPSSLFPLFDAYKRLAPSVWSGAISTLHYPNGWQDWGKVHFEVECWKGEVVITSVEQVGPFYDMQFVGGGPLVCEVKS